MGVFDSYGIILIMFSLSFLGWASEMYLSMTGDIVYSINPPIYYQMLDTVRPFIDFIRGSYFVLIFTLITINLLTNGNSSPDPLWFGAYGIMTFVLLWFLNQTVIPAVTGIFFHFQLAGVSNDWWYMFNNNWYFAALSGLLGAAIGYIKGAYAKKRGVLF